METLGARVVRNTLAAPEARNMDVYWLPPLEVIPPSFFAAALVPALITLAVRKFPGRTSRWVGALLGLPLTVLGIALLFTHLFSEHAYLEYLIHLITGSGFLITGILLPWLAWGIYLLRSAQPRWWAASLISLAALVFGTVTTGVIGSLAVGLGA